jgi:hypothetical protein
MKKGESSLYLVVEEVFRKVKSKGEYREQEPPNPHRRMTRRGRTTIRRVEGVKIQLTST